MKIMVIDTDDARGVALGIYAEACRQSAIQMEHIKDRKDDAKHSAQCYRAITGQDPQQRQLKTYIPEFAK